jgi:hypothetical protein
MRRGVLPHFLGDLHRAKVGPAHGAEVRELLEKLALRYPTVDPGRKREIAKAR